MAFSVDGQQVLVADGGNNRLQVFGLDGSFVLKVDIGALAKGVSVDRCGNVLALSDACVKVYSPLGDELLHHINLTDIVSEDEDGNREVGLGGLAIDAASGRLAVVDLSGKVSIL